MFKDRLIGEGITFDDILLVPAMSDVLPREVEISARLTRNIRLNIPLMSAAMDTVTESRLAIAIAQEGGMGIMHKNMTIDQQATEVYTVKRSENGVILDPVTMTPDTSIDKAREIMERNKISGVPVLRGNKLVGIVTSRDLRLLKPGASVISEIMTKDRLVTAPFGIKLDKAEKILHENKVEKLLLIDKQYALKGMITLKDIVKQKIFPNACKDDRGRLRVGAAVGVHDYNRVEALVRNGVDVIVVDTAHGHSRRVIETVMEVKKNFKIDVIAGNVATADGAKALIKAGADAIKVGIGPGSICTTRVVAGVGVPQITAIAECAAVASKTDTCIIADGGIKFSGDITKAIAVGAHVVMIGNLFAGLEESPGEVIYFQGRTYKTYRGMGSLGAMVCGSKDRYGQEGAEKDKLVPEGIEGRVPYKGALAQFVYQLIGGLRAGMGYCGAQTTEDLRTKSKFVRITNAGLRESHPHDIVISQGAPNYSVEL